MAEENILIIDDSREIVSFLSKKVLPGAGYKVKVSMTGQSGLKSLEEERPDLVLLDIELPDANGLDILKKLTQDEREIPVIMITAYGSESAAVEAFRIGARDYLIKPFSAEEVLRTIDHSLTEIRLRREKEALLERLGKRVQELSVLAAVGKSVANLTDTDQVLKRIVEAGVYITRAEEGFLLLAKPHSGDLVLRAAKNVEDKQAQSLHLRVEDSLAGKVFRDGKPIRLGGKAERHFKMKTGYLVKALLHVPLRLQGRTLGVLSVDNQISTRSLDESDEYLLSVLADYAAIALENASLRSQAQQVARRYRDLGTHIRELVIACDLDMNPLAANARALQWLGYEERELKALAAEHIFSAQTISRVKVFLEKENPTKPVVPPFPLTLITKEGEEIEAEATASPIQKNRQLVELQWFIHPPAQEKNA